MATEESRQESKASAPAAANSKRTLPGSFSAQPVKPAQQAALQPLRLPTVSTPPALMRTSVTVLRPSSCHTIGILRDGRAGDWLCSLTKFPLAVNSFDIAYSCMCCESHRRLTHSDMLQIVQGCIAYAASQEEVDSSCQSLLASGVPCLGFDIEWHVTYRQGTQPSPDCRPRACGTPPQSECSRWHGRQQRSR